MKRLTTILAAFMLASAWADYDAVQLEVGDNALPTPCAGVMLHAVSTNASGTVVLKKVTALDYAWLERRTVTNVTYTTAWSNLTHTVTNAGRAIALRPAEFRLLRLFMENPGLLFSRDRLIERLNADPAEDPLEDNTVSVYISRLRGAIGSRYIETVRGFGYRFRADAGKEDPS